MNHGVKVGEKATSISSIASSGNTAVIIGTAPVNMAADPKINEPVLCYTEKEAIQAFSYLDDWEHYTLCEAISTFFRLFKTGPVVFINVLNPEEHFKQIANETFSVTDGTGVINEVGVILDSLEIINTADSQPVPAANYSTSFNDDGTLNIVALTMADGDYIANFKALDPTLCTEDDIIGGVDINTFKSEGISLIPSVFTKFNRVPNIALAPGWTQIPIVAQTLISAMKNINEVFGGIVLTDIDTETVDNYSKVPEWKMNNSYVHETQFNTWPMGKLGDNIYHMSTLTAASIYVIDQSNGDIPFESPSNKLLNITGICLKDGTDVELDLGQANYLNDNGVATGLNFNNGWRLWGNKTGAYPANLDIKDNTLACKRMFIWDNNNFILTYWLDVDKPATPKLMDKIVDSYNDYYNGLVTKQAILGGRIEFNSADNPTTSLLDGKYYFKRYLTPVGVAQLIESDLEYDVEYLQTLFG